MEKYIYTYKSFYRKATVIEEYSIEAESQEEADYLICFGCGTLITKHKHYMGKLDSMELLRTRKEKS